jgi:hypothetical protein
MSAPLDTEQRRRYAALADVLVPARGGLPSATQAGAHEDGLIRVLAAWPSLGPSLTAILDKLDPHDDAETAVARLEYERKDDLLLLFTAIAGAYYLNDDVRRLIGYDGQRALGSDAFYPLDEQMLEPVRARGRVYREPP